MIIQSAYLLKAQNVSNFLATAVYFQYCALFSDFYSLLRAFVVRGTYEKQEIKMIWSVQTLSWNLSRAFDFFFKSLVSFNSFVRWLDRAIQVGYLDIPKSLAKHSILVRG